MPLLTPPSPRPAAPARYGLASLSTLVVLGVAVAQRDLGHEEILLLVPSAITAWYGGIGPAILASVLSTPALDYFFVPPLYSWSLPADRIPYIAVFPLFGFGIGWLTVSLRRAEESLVRARDQFEVKVQERTAELRRSNERLGAQAALLSLAHDAVLVRDPESRVVFWNPGAEETYGWTAEQAMGRVIHDLLQTKFPVSREAVDAALREHGRWEGELTHVTRGGATIVVASRWSLQRDERGAPRAILEINRDVTDRKRAEEEVQEQAALLRLAHDAILVRDLDNRIVFWNRGAEETYGWTAEQAMGRVTHDLLQTKFPVSREAVDAALREHGIWEGELAHVTRGGATIVVASRWSLQRDERGAPRAILEINRDVTDRKRAEEALRAAQADLAHFTRVSTLGELTASIAHEVNQPLAAVVTNAGACLRWLAHEPPVLEEARQTVHHILDDGNRASEVIERVRALVRRSPPRTTSLSINNTVLEVMALVRGEARSARVTLESQLADDLPASPAIESSCSR